MMERLRSPGLIPVQLVAIRSTLGTQRHLAGGATGIARHRRHRRLRVRHHREGDHTVASHRVGDHHRIGSGTINGTAVIFHRIGIGTHIYTVCGLRGFLHRQIDGHRAVTAVGGLIHMRENIRVREGLTIPDEAVAHHSVNGDLLALVDGQMQCHDAVAAVVRMEPSP